MSITSFNPKWITGKTVAHVEMNPQRAREDRDDRSLYHSPTITFTDGSQIVFMTEETDVGDYGTLIIYRKPARRRGGTAP